MIQRSIHYKSDFKLRLANEIDWSTPFKLRFFTTRPVSAMEVGYDGTTYRGCSVDTEGKLVVTFDRFTQLHRQGLGALMMELSYNIDDDQFADRSFDRILAPQKVVCIDDEDNEFELVLGLNGDSHVEVECSVIAAYKKGDPGDTPEIGENGNWWIGGVDTEVKADYSSEEALRQSQEAARVAAETTRQSNETQRQSGETTRQSNEATRQSKETERQTNETARQNAEAQRQQTFQTNEAARQTAYQNAEANRNGAYQEAEQDRNEEFASKEATRDAANQAALNCAETLAALGPKISYPNIIDISNTGEIVRGYLSNGQLKLQEGASFSLLSYVVNKGTTYNISGTVQGLGSTYQNVGFVQQIAANESIDVIVGTQEVGSSYSVSYTPSSNGYICVWRYTSSFVPSVEKDERIPIKTKISEIEESVSGLAENLEQVSEDLQGDLLEFEQEIDNSNDELYDLYDRLGIGTFEDVEELDSSNFVRGTLSEPGFIRISNDESYTFLVYYIAVSKRTMYHIQGKFITNAYLDGNYDAIGFAKNFANNAPYQRIADDVSGGNYDFYYKPSEDGYILIFEQITGTNWHKVSSAEMVKEEGVPALQTLSTQISTIETQLIENTTIPTQVDISNTGTLLGGYMSSGGRLTIGEYNYKILVFQVTAGHLYHIAGTIATFGNTYANLCFATEVTDGTLSTPIIGTSTVGSSFETDYTPSVDGYICLWMFTSTTLPSVLRTDNVGLAQVIEDIVPQNTRKNAENAQNIVCAGSSITWGDGALDSSMCKHLDKYIKENRASIVGNNSVEYSDSTSDFSNDLLYSGVGKVIEGVGSSVEFDIYGDEVAICQFKKRTSDYGIMNLYCDNVLIGTFDNKNTIGNNTETFSGTSIKKVQLAHPCTFGHSIVINGNTTIDSAKIGINTGGYGGTMPSDLDAWVYRTPDANGEPVHAIQFADSLGTITSVSVTYSYGRVVAHEKSTVGQLNDGVTNESRYGYGSTSFDPAQNINGLSSGQEFRAIDKGAFIVHKFNSAALRHFKIQIIGGSNPYFGLDFITNRFYNLMNAGIGGWQLSGLTDNNKVNDYNDFLKFFKPDVIYMEFSTNDDWLYGKTRRISKYIGEKSLEELCAIPYLEISRIEYNQATTKYKVYSCNGTISSITKFSLTSADIDANSTIQVGDIVRIGNYHGDNKQVVCREISSVDLTNGEISWKEPIFVENMRNVSSLSDLVGADFNVRDLSAYKTKYCSTIEAIRGIAPNAKIVIVSSGLSKYWARQLWGYDIVHRSLCNLYHNVEYCNVNDQIDDYLFATIDGSVNETVVNTNADSYTLSLKHHWQGFKVLVDGIDVYGKDCYIEDNYGYFPNSAITGSNADTSDVYAARSLKSSSISSTATLKLVFTSKPSASSTIEVQYSKDIWSSDYCHLNNVGGWIYANAYKAHL